MTKNSTHFDVLVVYSAHAARSAASKKAKTRSPFGSSERSNYDQSYAYFLDTCRDLGLKAALTTSADIDGPGSCSSYWLHDGGWTKVKQPGIAEVVFDKFSPSTAKQSSRRKLMFSNAKILPFNHPELYQMFYDKYFTYQALEESIPTVEITDNTDESARLAAEQLADLLVAHPNPEDFGSQYVLKNRFGSAGIGVHLVDSAEEIAKLLQNKPKIHFILQPLVNFEQGFQYKNWQGKTEIRLIFMNEKIVQTYIRVAAKDGFLCNDHQGGNSVYIKKSEVPKNVLEMAYNMLENLPEHNSLFALDFLVSDAGNPYLLEGNTGPGLNWDLGNKVDERKSKELIQIIVAKLAERVDHKKTTKVFEFFGGESYLTASAMYPD